MIEHDDDPTITSENETECLHCPIYNQGGDNCCLCGADPADHKE